MAKKQSAGVQRTKKINLIKPVTERPLYEIGKPKKELDRFDALHPWVQEVLKYFAEDTTEKILANMEEMKVSPYKEGDKQYSGKLKRAIHWTIVNNARGNTSMVEFYYLKYGDYLGIGASGWLNKKFGPIKPGMVPQMDSIAPVMIGKRPWGAKPFINSEIRRKAGKLARRLARQFAFQGGMAIMNTIVNTRTINDTQSYDNMKVDSDDFWQFVCECIDDQKVF